MSPLPANRYEEILQFFNHERELLVRLARDVSSDVIDLGKTYLRAKDGEGARKCFVTARTLAIGANQTDNDRAPLTNQLEQLEGPNGLIEQARQMRDGNH